MRITRNAQDPKGENSKFEETLRGFLRALEHTLGKYISKPIQLGRKTVDKGDKVALGPNFLDCQDRGINFLVIVLPDSDASTYKQIKTFGDIEYGITTVCVLDEARKFYSPPYGSATQYFANVALKINLKLGGTNHVLQNQTPLYETTMVIGIDVTHPSPGSAKKTAPSVAAMVASVDSEVIRSHFTIFELQESTDVKNNQLAQWPVDLRINTARKEMVELLGPMLATRLKLWQSKHGQSLPDHLLIYRDGVSENQYKAVLQQELGELRNACEVIYTGRKLPCITLIIVGKRHHTRFFKKIGPGNCTNPEFGT